MEIRVGTVLPEAGGQNATMGFGELLRIAMDMSGPKVKIRPQS
jgi:hypothetical protein